MDIEELRTFVEVADAGGVSPAALRLGVAKSIVSRRLLRLESELGVQLLARTTRGAALTEAGATFRDYAARVCTEIDVAKETIKKCCKAGSSNPAEGCIWEDVPTGPPPPPAEGASAMGEAPAN